MKTPQDNYLIYDLTGLVYHCAHSGTDPDANDSEMGNKLFTPGYALANFLDRYFLPFIDAVPLNHMIVVLDAGAEYRKSLAPTYKANRVVEDAEIGVARQVALHTVTQFCLCLGIPVVSLKGTEGDDVISYLCTRLPGSKTVFTVDFDIVALANDHTSVFVKGVKETTMRKGDVTIKAEHICLAKSIIGDPSDNIPGVPGCGPKFWENLVREYGESGLATLTDIVAAKDTHGLEKILQQQAGQHPLLERLQANIRQWIVSYQLALLHPELVDGRFKSEFRRLKWDKRLPDPALLGKLLEETGNKHYWPQLQSVLPQKHLVLAKDWEEDTLDEFVGLCQQSRFISLDWETFADENENFAKASTGDYVDMLGSKISGMGLTLGWNLEYTFYFSFDHADKENNLSKDKLVAVLKAIPANLAVVAQNAYFEMCVLKAELGLEFPVIYDTKIMATHVDEVNNSGLKDLSKRWLHYQQAHYRDVVPRGKTMQDVTSEQVFSYGADDAIVTAHLFDLFRLIMLLEGTWEFCRDNEFPALYPLVDSYLAGVSLDWEEVERQHQEDLGKFNENMAKIKALLKANQTEEVLARGAENWLTELQANYDGDTLYYTRLLTESMGAAWKRVDAINKLVNDRLVSDSPYEEIMEVYADEREKRRGLLANAAKLAVKYEDYETKEVIKPFKLDKNKVHHILLKAGLPGDVEGLETLLSGRTLTVAQRQLVHDLVSLKQQDSGNKRSESPAYQRVKQAYLLNPLMGIKATGFEMNINSPNQMQLLFFGMLCLPIRLRAFDVSDTRKERGLPGTPQVNEDVIRAALAEDAKPGTWENEVLTLLLEARKCDTRIKFFYKKFPLWRHPADNLIHPQFNSVGTETRRPSGSSPNLLQLSKKGEGVKVRRCFLPNARLGHKYIVSADWAAQEIRVAASLSKDSNLLACLVGDNLLDLHGVTASKMAGVEYSVFMDRLRSKDKAIAQEAKSLRSKAKNVVFGGLYGIGPGKLSRQLLCSRDEAKSYIDARCQAYPGYENWRRTIIQELHRTGYVTTQFGSRKHVFNLLRVLEDGEDDEGLISYYERATVNYKIQANCADYLKLVLSTLHKRQTFQRHGAVLLAPIYDEVVSSVPEASVIGFTQELCEVMTMGIPGFPDMPMLVNPSVGINFADQVEIFDDPGYAPTDLQILEALDKVHGRRSEAAA